ncbi:MFS transporter [Oleiagrimonas soli]|uniref:SHS family lactate transporter-like MFS transporter n=1 Tax=Oleiagrimonas soli TaxID=1543381 RepID=A0A099CVD9_9GAMM|nr:MFS transporter [Oleiagrimonas soli]KGI77557.1 sugar transporter [Oleiagrimonas soli]MBB6182962.1 SHS family lactate transporter-like MFS transporter [Oleiagrimonas soli]
MAFATLRSLTSEQRHTVLASFLGWTLDAFDFFLLVFVLDDVARSFGSNVEAVSFGILLTLAARPLGALLFGRLADRFGRRPVLMVDVALFSVLEFLCAFAPSLTVLLVLRFLFGIAMGGEWGIGAALAMESIPAKARGAVSGLLQSGYPFGYFLGALAYWVVTDVLGFGWRGMFVVGALPALLVLYLRMKVPESPAWEARAKTQRRQNVFDAMRGHWGLFVFMMLLMGAFNMFSHGSQDMYPTFLKQQLHLGAGAVTILTMLLNAGAIVGGLSFGAWSERIGRRRAIIIAALLAIPVVPLWMFGGAVAAWLGWTAPIASLVLLGAGAFLIQVMVQGAWGIVPTHLNELAPGAVRGTLPGFAYQLGNLLAAATATAQAALAARLQGDYAAVMAVWLVAVALLLAFLAWLGPEARGQHFDADQA